MKTRYILAVMLAVISLTTSAQKKNSKTESFKVSGACEQCKNRIEKVLSGFGTYKSNWDIETQMLTVSYDSTRFTKAIIQKKMADIGHDNEAFLADDPTYEKLPLCCHYERELKNLLPVLSDTSLAVHHMQEAMQPEVRSFAGQVFEPDSKGGVLPLAGATVSCINTSHTSVTDSMGLFNLTCTLPVTIAISYVGFKPDTLNITSTGFTKVVLQNTNPNSLNSVVVQGRNQSTYISGFSTLNTLKIGTKELAKAACCNLSESFETSPSVDVSYADAVTGMKQIQLLGLSGNYTQMLTENTPEIRGLAGSYGLTFIPGPWIDGIEVTKGTGSVANGYESIAGQINIEEKKPDKADKLFINAYANSMGRLESSVNLAKKISDKWSTALLAHVNGTSSKQDKNNDGFMDNPTGRQINLVNRWKYVNDKGLIAQLAIKALTDKRQAGQTDFDPGTDKFTTNKYGVGIDVRQYEMTGKLGYVFPGKLYKSVGLIFSAINYNNSSYYGLTKYDGSQKSFYGNLIYQSVFGNTGHKYRTGISLVNDDYNETFDVANYKRKETVSGAFFEYTYTAPSKFTAILGLREDYHNQYGFITTPRVHLKYDFTPNSNLRFSAGSGFRVANIFAENNGVFVSARKYSILNPGSNYGYGLDPEKAWNYGFNFVHNFKVHDHAGSFIIDLYHTSFTNQTVTDLDAGPQQILFYNLSGKSFSNSLQLELNYEPIKKLELRLAGRWLDVQTNYGGTMLQKPLVAKYRAFVNAAYETKNHWKFDLTTQWLSRKRLPNTSSNPAAYQLGEYSPSYVQMSGQISKQIGSKWELYTGMENITNYTQDNLIIAASQPFSPYFDGSVIWGPVNGRVWYGGMRFKIK